VRRGRDTAEIYSIAIARDLKWLAVSSDKGTVHVFSLVIRKDDVQSAATSVPPTDTVSSNARSSLSFMKGEHTNSVSSSRATLLKSLPHSKLYYFIFQRVAAQIFFYYYANSSYVIQNFQDIYRTISVRNGHSLNSVYRKSHAALLHSENKTL
jgi:hypothetical protein